MNTELPNLINDLVADMRTIIVLVKKVGKLLWS